ncbi:hypothetical protein GCM10020218_053690 [Dactylosporangium vinaceum]
MLNVGPAQDLLEFVMLRTLPSRTWRALADGLRKAASVAAVTPAGSRVTQAGGFCPDGRGYRGCSR